MRPVFSLYVCFFRRDHYCTNQHAIYQRSVNQITEIPEIFIHRTKDAGKELKRKWLVCRNIMPIRPITYRNLKIGLFYYGKR